jgi:hypothetical protein
MSIYLRFVCIWMIDRGGDHVRHSTTILRHITPCVAPLPNPWDRFAFVGTKARIGRYHKGRSV